MSRNNLTHVSEVLKKFLIKMLNHSLQRQGIFGMIVEDLSDDYQTALVGYRGSQIAMSSEVILAD